MGTKYALDPRTKLYLVLCLSTLCVAVGDLRLLLAILLAAALALKAAGGSITAMAGKLKQFVLLFLIIVVVQSIFTRGGAAVLRLGQVNIITDMGLVRGTQTLLRFLIVLISAALVTTSNPRDIIQGMIQLKIPPEIAFMVTMAIRFLPLLRDEAVDILTAIQLRGVNLKKIPLLRRLKMYTYLLAPLITSVLLKAGDLSLAMEMRAFRAYPRRTSLRTLVLQRADYAVMALVTAFALGVAAAAISLK